MEIEIYDLVQECCDKEKKYRKFTYSCAKSESIFYLFAKKKDVNIFEELKVFDSLYENYKLKSLGWTKFSAGYIPNDKFPGYITEEKYQNIYF